jgi:hypothetical protein
VFLEILRSFECLAAEFALMGLQGDVDTDVGGDVVALDCGCAALAPGTSQVQVVGGLAADMTFANMVLKMIVSEAEVMRGACIHRGLLAMSIARRIPATDTASFRRQRQRRMTVERLAEVDPVAERHLEVQAGLRCSRPPRFVEIQTFWRDKTWRQEDLEAKISKSQERRELFNDVY